MGTAMAHREGSGALRHASRRRALLGAVMSFVLALSMVPAAALAAVPTSQFGWYTSHAGTADDPYLIGSREDFAGLAELVNGTAVVDGKQVQDSFAGKYVKLARSVNFRSADVVPAGGANGAVFEGDFDGAGFALNNFTIVADRAENLGVFGEAGEGSAIHDVTLGAQVKMTVSQPENSETAIENVGMLVGATAGSISNVATSGTLSVSHGADQSRNMVFAVKNVGGIAGKSTGSISGCIATASASLSVSEPGKPVQLTDGEDKTWEEQSVLVINVGGIVGCFGDQDSSIDNNLPDKTELSDEQKAARVHGTIEGCSNASVLTLDTPCENGKDRFGNVVYSQSSNVGGVVGYSRGSVLSCANTGKLLGDHMSGSGGVVGSLRSKTTTSSYNGNFSSEGFDDGWDGGDLVVSDCTNSGIVYGYSFPAGIVGRAGTYTTITRCVNESSARVCGTRPNKPFTSGIVGGSYGTTSYCANFGWLMSGTWKNPSLGPEAGFSTGAGYFVSGIAGNTSFFSQLDADAGTQVRKSPLPEVYGCLSAGQITATDNMRQRLLVGDNAGYLHDSVGIKGLCYNDALAYGMYETDTETSGGSVSNVIAVDADVARSNGTIGVLQEDGTYAMPDKDNKSVKISLATSVIQLLNARCGADGWATYWSPSDGEVNGGFPVLDTQIAWDKADLSTAAVSLESNAGYNGGEAVPDASVVLNGKKLMQNVDYKVIPQTGATELSDGAPYTATVEGIGSYKGTASQQFAYDIKQGDISLCTVSIDQLIFNWKSQAPTASMVHVYNSVGGEVSSSEFSFAFDESDEDLTVNPDTGAKEAVNAGRYAMIIKALPDSEHFFGQTTGEFPIKTAKIIVDPDASKNKDNAIPTGITYQGKSYPWESYTVLSSYKQEPSNTFSYTGYPLKPTIDSVVYKGEDLQLGRDYRIVYGAGLMDGQTVKPGQENVGVAGGIDKGYVTARYVPGGNFSNYDTMPFFISDTGSLDLGAAEIRNNGPVIFEEGAAYKPIQLFYGGSQLREGVDYTIEYRDNDALGTASFTATAVAGGRFTGSISGTFEIVEGNAYTLTYVFDDDAKTATVTGVNYAGSRDSFGVAIPASVEHDGVAYAVTAIADKAFGGASAAEFTGANSMKKHISSVTIPATVRTIGKYAFSSEGNDKWNDLASVVFDDVERSQLVSIGDGAFQGCGNLSEMTIPARVATIGNRAFNMGTISKPASLNKLTFLATDPALPSTVGTALTFSGVGFDGNAVEVHGYGSATAVKQLVADNAAATSGKHKGRNFTFVEMPAPAPDPDPDPDPTPDPDPDPQPATISRLAGDDSPQTSAAISAATFEAADAVILAKSTDFMDAMSATGLAGAMGAPILLTQPDGMAAETIAEIERLGAKRVVIVGGVNAVGAAVAAQCEQIVGAGNVERIAGYEAYDTSVECANRIAQATAAIGEPCDKAIVAYSQNFKDALSISSFAYKYHVPIILETYGDLSPDRFLTDEGKQLLTDGAFKDATVFVPGGPGAVSTDSVEGVVGAGRVQRMFGNDGYDTSNAIAAWMTTHGDSADVPYLDARYVAIACGADKAHGTDALAGAALAGAYGGVMLLANAQTDMEEVNTVAIDGFLAEHASSVDKAWVLGGGYVMPQALYDRVAALIGAE